MPGCCAAALAPATESTSSVVITTSRFRHGEVPRRALIYLTLTIGPPQNIDDSGHVAVTYMRCTCARPKSPEGRTNSITMSAI